MEELGGGCEKWRECRGGRGSLTSERGGCGTNLLVDWLGEREWEREEREEDLEVDEMAEVGPDEEEGDEVGDDNDRVEVVEDL